MEYVMSCSDAPTFQNDLPFIPLPYIYVPFTSSPQFPSLHFALFITLLILFSFFIFYTVGRTPWTGDQPVARPLPTHRAAQTQNKSTQTSMQVGFESTTPVFEQSKIDHALDRAATAIGNKFCNGL
jgi:hypothetical protein